MYILKPHIFNKFPEIIFGFSTKISGDLKAPYFFNLSYSVGDDRNIVDKNRQEFFQNLGLSVNDVAYQKQIHSDIIKTVDCAGNNGESDSLITDKKNLGLAVSIADCTPVFLYDFKRKVIAAVHSGWRGTELRILEKTLSNLKKNFNSDPKNITAYIGPSISQINYEVGSDVAVKFDDSFTRKKGEKFLLDVSGINYKMLLDSGVPENQIQRSRLCTYEFSELLHSYRRDGKNSGRSMGIIALKY